MTAAPKAFVIGHPIAHSRSPLLHGFWLEQLCLPGSYEKIDVAPDALPAFIGGLRQAGFSGGNVTVPHKTAVMGLVDDVDEAARAIGAANTLWFEAGRLRAGNTDAFGFVANLDAEAPGWDASPGMAIVLGAGGAARAVVHGLLARGFAITVVNRTRETAAALAAHVGAGVSAHAWDALPGLLGTAGLLVNTTSLGMAGKLPLAVDLSRLRPEAVVCDIVYVPLETDLLRQARARGNRVVDGLGMLLHQAVPGFERWFGVRPTVTPALRALIEDDLRRPART
jgi:shikimate dehydrogenase